LKSLEGQATGQDGRPEINSASHRPTRKTEVRTLIPAAALFDVTSAAAAVALPMSDYPEYHGTWSLSCKNPTADRVVVSAESITVHQAGPMSTYRGLGFSHSGGMARADGKRAWIFTGIGTRSSHHFVAEVPGYKRKGHLEIDSDDPAVQSLIGKKFQKCPAR
jgi:hypothetical protein